VHKSWKAALMNADFRGATKPFIFPNRLPSPASPRAGRRAWLFLALALIVFGLVPVLETRAQTQEAARTITDPPLPQTLTLCGEKVPLEDRHVWEMLDRELTIAIWDRAQVLMWLKRAGRYFPYIEERLAQAGLPSDLKYLAVAESSLITNISSNRSALGMWQFMADTAQSQGLQANSDVDERLNYRQATRAALKHLGQLHDEFGSWALAMAAYNCGRSCVKEEIEEQQVQDYYRLNLPNETERFVFRIAAIKVILENPEKYGYHLPPERIYRPETSDVLAVELPAPVHVTELAKALGTTYKALKELNPEFQGRYLPTGKFNLIVPAGQGPAAEVFFEEAKKTFARESKRVEGRIYVVQRGDTLSGVSRKTGVPVKTLRQLNRISGSKILVGQRLRLSR